MLPSEEINAWVCRVVDRVRAGARAEDDCVELKSDWISPEKAARRLAGFINAAAAEHVLWIVGVDDGAGTFQTPPTVFDIAEWHGKLERLFGGTAPRMQTLHVEVEGASITALCFETAGRPHVLPVAKDPNYFEVPWRAGTQTRSARRDDLLQLMHGRDEDAEQERRIIASLQSLKDTHSPCVLRPRIPRPIYPVCRVRYVSRAFVEFESGQFTFRVPTKRVTEIIEAWSDLSAEICIQGRIQWL